MAVPTLADAEHVLASFDLPTGIVTHSRGVSRVAGEAARLLAAAGVEVDADLVAVAALLHDIDKQATRDDPGQHGTLAALWVTEGGWSELAAAIASHPIGRLLDPARAPQGWAAKAVAVADRHVAQAFVSIDQRIDEQASRHPDFAADLDRARSLAHAMQAELAAAAGLTDAALEARLRAAWELEATG